MQGLEWRPIRRRLGISSFGSNAYTAAKPGDWIRLGLIVAASNRAGLTCLGFALPDRASCCGTFSVTLGGRRAQLNVGPRQVPLRLDGASPYLLRVAG